MFDQKLANLFNELRNAIVDELNDDVANETDAANEFSEREANLNNEYNEFQRQLNDGLY